MLVEQCRDAFTGLLPAALHLQHILDLVEGQVEGLGLPDEMQHVEVVSAEQAVAGRGALRLGEEPLRS